MITENPTPNVTITREEPTDTPVVGVTVQCKTDGEREQLKFYRSGNHVAVDKYHDGQTQGIYIALDYDDVNELAEALAKLVEPR